MYDPAPIDTTDAIIPSDILELAEKLAENTHNTWARARIDQGWTYGPIRDEYTKQTPCLVSYKELPEEEKEFDRTTAIETIKLITKLGYSITKE